MPNYQKKALKADCIQWTGKNREDIVNFCSKYNLEVSNAGANSGWLVLRGDYPKGLPPKYWIVIQENEELRTYSPEKFKLLYEQISDNSVPERRTEEYHISKWSILKWMRERSQ